MLSRAVLKDLQQFINDHILIYSSVCAPPQLDEKLEGYIGQHKKPGFTATLLKMMDAHGGKDSEIYTKAGLDRRHFSKIRSNLQYRPSKITAIALALALELNREEADTLLTAAGYTLSESETFDLIIAYCIEKSIYNLNDVNQALEYFSQKTIGTIA